MSASLLPSGCVGGLRHSGRFLCESQPTEEGSDDAWRCVSHHQQFCSSVACEEACADAAHAKKESLREMKRTGHYSLVRCAICHNLHDFRRAISACSSRRGGGVAHINYSHCLERIDDPPEYWHHTDGPAMCRRCYDRLNRGDLRSFNAKTVFPADRGIDQLACHGSDLLGISNEESRALVERAHAVLYEARSLWSAKLKAVEDTLATLRTKWGCKLEPDTMTRLAIAFRERKDEIMYYRDRLDELLFEGSSSALEQCQEAYLDSFGDKRDLHTVSLQSASHVAQKLEAVLEAQRNVSASDFTREITFGEMVELVKIVEETEHYADVDLASYTALRSHYNNDFVEQLALLRDETQLTEGQVRGVLRFIRGFLKIPTPNAEHVFERSRKQRRELLTQLKARRIDDHGNEFSPKRILRKIWSSLSSEDRRRLQKQGKLRIKLGYDGRVWFSQESVICTMLLIGTQWAMSPLSHFTLSWFGGSKTVNWETFDMMQKYFTTEGKLTARLRKLKHQGIYLGGNHFQVEFFHTSDLKGARAMFNLTKSRSTTADSSPRPTSYTKPFCLFSGCSRCLFEKTDDGCLLQRPADGVPESGEVLECAMDLELVSPDNFLLCLLHAYIRCGEGLLGAFHTIAAKAQRKEQTCDFLKDHGIQIGKKDWMAGEASFKVRLWSGENAYRLMANAREIGIHIANGNPRLSGVGEFHQRLNLLLTCLNRGPPQNSELSWKKWINEVEQCRLLAEEAREEFLGCYSTQAQVNGRYVGTTGSHYYHILCFHATELARRCKLIGYGCISMAGDGLEALHRLQRINFVGSGGGGGRLRAAERETELANSPNSIDPRNPALVAIARVSTQSFVALANKRPTYGQPSGKSVLFKDNVHKDLRSERRRQELAPGIAADLLLVPSVTESLPEIPSSEIARMSRDELMQALKDRGYTRLSPLRKPDLVQLLQNFRMQPSLIRRQIAHLAEKAEINHVPPDHTRKVGVVQSTPTRNKRQKKSQPPGSADRNCKRARS